MLKIVWCIRHSSNKKCTCSKVLLWVGWGNNWNSFQLISCNKSEILLSPAYPGTDQGHTRSPALMQGPYLNSSGTLSQGYGARCACSSAVTVPSSVPQDRQEGKYFPSPLPGTDPGKPAPSERGWLKTMAMLQMKRWGHSDLVMSLYTVTLQKECFIKNLSRKFSPL